MKPSVAIITAIYGGYETLKPTLPQFGHLVDWVCVTDNPAIVQPSQGAPWRIVVDPSPEVAIMSAKRAKMMPWAYTGCKQSIWLDASMRVASVYTACGMIDRAHPIAQFAHPERDCIFEEALISAQLARYAGLPLLDQCASYQHPKHWGLWAAGAIAVRHTTQTRDFMQSWYLQCQQWGWQDQLSEPPMLARSQLRPVTLPGSIYDNQWLKYEPSERHREEQR